jgi:hypothetical protein
LSNKIYSSFFSHKKPYSKKFLISICLLTFIFSLVPLDFDEGLKAKAEAAPSYDVIVVGSDPEGIAAAISAKKNGLKTLLVDHRQVVGGLYTLGWLNTIDLNYKETDSNKILQEGIFKEFYQGIGSKEAFDINKAQETFEGMLEKYKVDTLLGVDRSIELQIEARGKGKTIKGITVSRFGKKQTLFTKILIDATQDGDMAAKARVPYDLGRKDLGFPNQIGATTLVFKVKNVDWPTVKADLNKDNNIYTGATEASAWGYEIMFQCPTKDPDIQIRGFNAGRQADGTVVINALQIFNLNPLSEAEKKEVFVRAKNEMPRIMDFIRENLVGWEQAELVSLAPELYIRESRHFEGVKKLTAEDIFQNRFPKDRVALGSYPIDIQAREKGMTGCALNGMVPYGISLGVMVPKDINNLLIASRCASYDGIAHGSARVVPIGMAMGEAAGVAAKQAIQTGKPLPTIAVSPTDISQIQQVLKKQGVKLDPIYNQKIDISKHWSFPYIKLLRNKGMLSMGYHNDYKLAHVATFNTFRRMYVLINYNSTLSVPMDALKPFKNSDKVTVEDYLKLVSGLTGRPYTSLEQLLKAGLLDETIYSKLQNKTYITNDIAYALTACYIQK